MCCRVSFGAAISALIFSFIALLCVAAVKQLAEDSRKHANNLSFDVWQQTNRPNHFTVVESWGNRGSFDLHEMQKETREFRTKLATMTGALYDERLYKMLK